MKNINYENFLSLSLSKIIKFNNIFNKYQSKNNKEFLI